MVSKSINGRIFCLALLVSCLCVLQVYGGKPVKNTSAGRDIYSELAESPYFGEKVATFVYEPRIRIHINAPAERDFDREKPTKIVFYALPNGNSTDWTIGKLPAAGDDWHYQIQHIGAQTRYVRRMGGEYNLVTVYMEAETRSWGSWRKAGLGRDKVIREAVEYIVSLFGKYDPHVELNSHSGGGNFIFGFMDAHEEMPDYVKKVTFLDSDYNWDNERYGGKLVKWLEAGEEHCLFVACYDDANALYEGRHFVSRKGGTWYRSDVMRKYVKRKMRQLKWEKVEDDSIRYYTAGNRRIQFFFRKNPEQQIYHTILVERNGFIQSVLVGTEWEQQGYSFMGERVYDAYRQDSVVMPHIFAFPPRRATAMTGSELAARVAGLNAAERDSVVYGEIVAGNMPSVLRQPVYLTDTLRDGRGDLHRVTLLVTPDYLSVGSDSDFIRMPMLPATAQRLADRWGAVLPTSKISDLIYRHAEVKLVPHPMMPDATMTTMSVFARHNSLVEKERRATGKPLGVLVAGHKKDIVITPRMDREPGRLFIYGWHTAIDKPIQPLSAAHNMGYVDYSHGVRLVSDEVLVDGKLYSLRKLLQAPVWFRLLSDEAEPMKGDGYVWAE